MNKRMSLFSKLTALCLVLVLVVPILAACDDDDDEDTTTQASTTPAPTTTPTATTPTATTPTTTTTEPTTTQPPVSTEPVKIGVVMAWTGVAGMAGVLADRVIDVIEDQVEQRGGIDVGGVMRPLEIVKCDSGSDVAGSEACWTKLALEDEVSAVVYGGATAPETITSADSAEEFEVPFFTFSPSPADLSETPFTIRTTNSQAAVVDTVTDFIVGQLDPATVALLSDEGDSGRSQVGAAKKVLEDAGVDIIFEQYIAIDTKDMSPFLTRIKSEDPDLIVHFSAGEPTYITTFRQIMELGGWGDIEYVSLSAASSGHQQVQMAGAVGTYHWIIWMPGLPYPGAQEFEQAYEAKHGSAPAATDSFFYLPIWTAIHAIELAESTDPVGIARAARSGNLTWESPVGPLTFTSGGENDLSGIIALIAEGGEFILQE